MIYDLFLIAVSFRLFLSLNSDEHASSVAPPVNREDGGGTTYNTYDVLSASHLLRSSAEALGYNCLHIIVYSQVSSTTKVFGMVLGQLTTI